MREDQFTRLFKYLTERFDVIELKLDNKADRSQVERLQDSVDGVAGHLRDEQIEQAAITSQLSRHDSWIQQLAKKLGVQLTSE